MWPPALLHPGISSFGRGIFVGRPFLVEVPGNGARAQQGQTLRCATGHGAPKQCAQCARGSKAANAARCNLAHILGRRTGLTGQYLHDIAKCPTLEYVE